MSEALNNSHTMVHLLALLSGRATAVDSGTTVDMFCGLIACAFDVAGLQQSFGSSPMGARAFFATGLYSAFRGAVHGKPHDCKIAIATVNRPANVAQESSPASSPGVSPGE